MAKSTELKTIDEICKGMPRAPEKYCRAALKFMRDPTTSGQTVELKPSMPEWTEWSEYFRTQHGFYPAGMGYVLDNRCKSFLVPALRPQWFDPAYYGR